MDNNKEADVEVNNQEYSNQKGIRIDVSHLHYAVIIDKERKMLLNDISLSMEAGNMIALMGPSGAGNLLYFMHFSSFLYTVYYFNEYKM